MNKDDEWISICLIKVWKPTIPKNQDQVLKEQYFFSVTLQIDKPFSCYINSNNKRKVQPKAKKIAQRYPTEINWAKIYILKPSQLFNTH